jgi:hypothetical protein
MENRSDSQQMDYQNDLKLRCEACKGRGYRESLPFREWADEVTPVISTIKLRCASCGGSGHR